MAFDVKLTIAGLQEAQAENLRVIALMEPDNLGKVVRYVTAGLHRHAVAYTHVGSYVQSKSGSYYYGVPGVGGGALRASHQIAVSGTHGSVFIDPGAVNPRTGRRPAEYGVYEFERGGQHDAYGRAVEGHADELVDKAIAAYLI